MKKQRRQLLRALCLGMACVCLFLVCGCSPAPAGTATTAPETTEAPSETTTQNTAEMTGAGMGFGIGFGEELRIRHVDGIEIISGRVEGVSGSMVYTPDPGSGFFTVNGTIAEDSMIAISVHPVGVLRYKLTLDAAEDKTVRTEIRVYKNNQMLVSCVQEETKLVKGENDIDVCIDTNEGRACAGIYDVRCYMDDLLVSRTDYSA